MRIVKPEIFPNTSYGSGDYVRVDFTYTTNILNRRVIFRYNKRNTVSLTIEDRKIKGDVIQEKKTNNFNFNLKDLESPISIELISPSSPKQTMIFDLVDRVKFDFRTLPSYRDMGEAIKYFKEVIKYVDKNKNEPEGIPYGQI